MSEQAGVFYAWVEVEPDGRQGMIAAIVPGLETLGPVLLHHRTRALAEKFRKLAIAHGQAAGRPVWFVEYQQSSVLEVHDK